MSNQIFRAFCPNCGRDDMVGQVREMYESVDVKTGEVVFRSDPEWTKDMECGVCDHHWQQVKDAPEVPCSTDGDLPPQVVGTPQTREAVMGDNEEWDTEEHWDVNAFETTVTECESCGERRPCQLVIDPFVAEGIAGAEGIYDEKWWCRPCFDRRRGDV